MRIVFTLFLIIITLSVNAQLTNGLVAHWDFNGNANDLTANGLNGTATNVTYTTGKAGAANSAARFNGTSSYITVPYKSNLNLNRFSICAMVKVEGYYSGNCQASAILWRGSQWQNGYYSLIFFDNPFDLSCGVMDTSKNVFAGQMGNLIATPSATQWRYTPAIVSQKWYCVITTFDSVQSKIYVDGVLKSTYNVSAGAIGTSTEALAIGGNRFGGSGNYPYWMKGVIDDLRIYNRVLTPVEITSFCGLFDTTIVVKDSIAKKNICMDDTFHLPYTVTDQFKTGNVFTAQLSDATGNFSTPVNIGTITSSVAGTIVCNVPTVTAGSAYRVRIVSTNPVRISDVTSPFGIYSTLIPSVSIIATPSGPYVPNQFITFISTPVDAGTAPIFQWYRNGNIIPGANDDSLYINTLNDGDSIYVVVTSSNPCPADLSAQSNKIHVSITSSVNDIQLPNLNLYPNPNNGNFNISANSITYSEVLLEVMNPLGQIIIRKQVSVTDATLNERVESGQLSSGIYLLRISADGKQRNIRFTVSN